MLTRSTFVLLATGLLVFVFSTGVQAQIASTTYAAGMPDEIRVFFVDDIKTITLANTLVFFEDNSGKIVQIWCDASQTSGFKNAVSLKNFHDADQTSVNLMMGGGSVPKIISGTRTYNIVLKGVQLIREPRARPIQTSVDLNSPVNRAPVIDVKSINNAGTAQLPYNRRAIKIQPDGLKPSTLLSKFEAAPGKIRIQYKFSKDDPSPDIETSGASIKTNGPAGLVIEPKEKLPIRAKKYTVKLLFPADQLRGSEEANYQIPADAEFVQATTVAELIPSGQTERAKTAFYVETTFTSTVSQKDRKRTKVGIFGIHWKPTLPLLTYNVFGESVTHPGAGKPVRNRPIWMAFRPLLEADFDTQSPKVSKSPNRIQIGMDYELGRDAGRQEKGHLSLIQQHVWINGLRYDSDRDFKLQTIYWHTEYVPRFLDFEQTTEERQYAFDMATQNLKPGRKGPFVSSYRIKPSIGYELGGIVKRDSRATNVPADKISRPFFGLDLALEFERTLKFGLTNTYYYLQNVDRRRNRDYLEGRIELNTGFLFNRNFNGLQNAITLKFQRGYQPPTFGSVNALSLGFKIFK
jgi:hypothetical protein